MTTATMGTKSMSRPPGFYAQTDEPDCTVVSSGSRGYERPCVLPCRMRGSRYEMAVTAGVASGVATGATVSCKPSTPTTTTLAPAGIAEEETAFQISPWTRTLPCGESAVRATP